MQNLWGWCKVRIFRHSWQKLWSNHVIYQRISVIIGPCWLSQEVRWLFCVHILIMAWVIIRSNLSSFTVNSMQIFWNVTNGPIYVISSRWNIILLGNWNIQSSWHHMKEALFHISVSWGSSLQFSFEIFAWRSFNTLSEEQKLFSAAGGGCGQSTVANTVFSLLTPDSHKGFPLSIVILF